jgi:uncharacterized membrane protein YeiH
LVDAHSPWQLYLLLTVVFVLRMLSVIFHWHVPKRKWATTGSSKTDAHSL